MLNPQQIASLTQFFQVRLDLFQLHITWSYIWDTDANIIQVEPWFSSAVSQILVFSLVPLLGATKMQIYKSKYFKTY